jgi:hypothetical protein
MHQKKIIKEYDGIGRIESDLYNLRDVELEFRLYRDGALVDKAELCSPLLGATISSPSTRSLPGNR